VRGRGREYGGDEKGKRGNEMVARLPAFWSVRKKKQDKEARVGLRSWGFFSV